MRKRKIWSLYGASTHLEVIIYEIILNQLYWIHNAMQDIKGIVDTSYECSKC